MTQSEMSETPAHLAIIMDGNGRWAQQRGLTRTQGHKAGAERAREAVEIAAHAGIQVVSLFAFSSENWARPDDEIRDLFFLLDQSLHRHLDLLTEQQVELQFIGDQATLPNELQMRMAETSRLTRQKKPRLRLVIAIGYGGRWDLLQAVRHIAADVRAGILSPEAIDERLLSGYLATSELPDPDLLIRTGGESRISNFFLWDTAYTELFFSDFLWPDFDEAALQDALAWYSRRQRRFGQTGEQLVSDTSS